MGISIRTISWMGALGAAALLLGALWIMRPDPPPLKLALLKSLGYF
jgi:hypothetical protein